MKALYLTKVDPPPSKVWTPAFQSALAGHELSVEHMAADAMDEQTLLAKIRSHEVLLLSWDSPMIPSALEGDPGALRYICHLTGSVREYIPEAILGSDIVVTNWGASTGPPVAEGALTLLLACLKNIRAQIEDKCEGKWVCGNVDSIGSLQDMKLGLYGFGHIGRRFYEFVRPMGPDVCIYDPFAGELPVGCRRAASLRDLFVDSEAVAIFAALTEQTRGSVDKELLALLPDQAIVVNTARGDIINQNDLLAEIATGRLRAGLDVLADPDWLPLDHEAIKYRNLILTSHRVGDSFWQTPVSNDAKKLSFFHKACIANLIRYRDGQPLENVVTRAQFARMT